MRWTSYHRQPQCQVVNDGMSGQFLDGKIALCPRDDDPFPKDSARVAESE